MEATMRKFLLISVVVLSASAAHAGLDVTAANTDPRPPEATRQTQPSSARRPDADVLAAKRQAMIQQKTMMRKQMMMREMQRHPIRTRIHFGILKLKRKLRYAFH